MAKERQGPGDVEKLRDVLREFINDIDCTGGVIKDRKGLHRPVADIDWIDIGETYMRACAVLGHAPVIEEGEE